ncbi:hypothetical protein D3C77_541270 [compost metagenome]
MQARQENDELVTAQASHGIDVSNLFFQALGDAFEQQVTDGMTETVVDMFEAVQVEEQHGSLAFRGLGAGEGSLQAALEQGAVWQSGERIMVRLVIKFCLGMLEA